MSYELIPSRNQEWCVRLPSGRLASSSRNPRREAARRCQSVSSGQEPLLIGAGGGYELLHLANSEVGRITVLEPDAAWIQVLGELWKRLGEQPKHASIQWIDGQSSDTLDHLSQEMASDHGERPLLIDPASVERWETDFPVLAGLARDLLTRRASAHRQEQLLQENEQRNLELLGRALDYRVAKGIWGSASTLVCGAGPSLETWLDRRLPRPERLIAVSTALPVLQERGLEPDLVVATDPSPLLGADCSARLDGGHLLCFPGTSPDLLAAWPGEILLALPGGNGLRDTEWQGRQPGVLEAGFGTVAGPALLAASELSLGPLQMVGVDLSMDGCRYACGVRRPVDMPQPDFALARRRMRGLCHELSFAGRSLSFPVGNPDWLQEGSTNERS